MKQYRMLAAVIMCALALPVAAEKKATKVQSTVKEGKYSETDTLTVAKLPYLPIPGTKEDYVIFQSMGKSSTVVVGRFASGEKEILLLIDENGDGKVDTCAVYYPDSKKFKNVSQPDREYPADKFKKMKEDIIHGVRGDLNPNAEGMEFVKKAAEKKTDIVSKVRYKNGFRVFINDSDDPNMHRAIFYFSNNRKSGGGADLAFKVEFHNVGNQMVSPIIGYNVYCKDSEDPVVVDAVDELSKYTAKYFGE